MNLHADMTIEALGGTAAVSRLFGISMPSVSGWKQDGIPPARVMYLKVAHKKILKGIDLDAATARKPRKQPTPQEA